MVVGVPDRAREVVGVGVLLLLVVVVVVGGGGSSSVGLSDERRPAEG